MVPEWARDLVQDWRTGARLLPLILTPAAQSAVAAWFCTVLAQVVEQALLHPHAPFRWIVFAAALLLAGPVILARSDAGALMDVEP